MVQQTNKTTESKQAKGKTSILLRMKEIAQKFKGSAGSKQKKSKVFNLTRGDAIISMTIALLTLIGAGFYGREVRNDYVELNNQANSLKNLSTHNIQLDTRLIYPYIEGEEAGSISELIGAHTNIQSKINEYEEFQTQQTNYYEVLLKNIYLPSLNVWKDPYTKNFDMTVLGQKYLDTDKFQDLFLIQYWSDFLKYVGNDADYNTVESISIGDKIAVEANSDYFYTPISITFSSPNKRSFLLLVNKLSTTSNQSNVSLINEFFFYLLNAIKEDKQDTIAQLMEKYREEFSSSSDWEFQVKNLGDLTPEQESKYIDRIIGYYLYHWINDDGVIDEKINLIDDKVIEKAIKQGTLCNVSDSNQRCFYNFREKYRNLPYLAYNIGLEKQTDRVEGLLNFLRSLPPIITISDFSFEKSVSSTFLNNGGEQYNGSVTFNAYGRNITDKELEEAAISLGKICFGSESNQKISSEKALERVNQVIGSLGESREYANISSLGELQQLFTEIDLKYEVLSNYNKMVKLFEIWRMMNDANLCIQ